MVNPVFSNLNAEKSIHVGINRTSPSTGSQKRKVESGIRRMIAEDELMNISVPPMVDDEGRAMIEDLIQRNTRTET